jgi:hypothetical protein
MIENKHQPSSIVEPPFDRVPLVLPVDRWMNQNYFRLQSGWLSVGFIVLLTLYLFHPSSAIGILPDAVTAEFSPMRNLPEIMMRAGALEFFWLFVFQTAYLRSASGAAKLLQALSWGFLLWVGLNIGLLDYFWQFLDAPTSFFFGSKPPPSPDVVVSMGRPVVAFDPWDGGSIRGTAIDLGNLQSLSDPMLPRKVLVGGALLFAFFCLLSPFPFLCAIFAELQTRTSGIRPVWLYLGLAVTAAFFSSILAQQARGEIPAAGTPLAVGVFLVVAAAIGYGWWLDRQANADDETS